MSKYYIQTGTFRTTIARPNVIQALIGTFDRLEQENLRHKLGDWIMVDQRGFVYDLLSPESNNLLGIDYLKARRKACREIKLCYPNLGFLSSRKETLFFRTKNVVEIIQRLNGSK
jgi:hypothetical protein